MGIRILCPNGHRLNIKSFLAGKRGICPHCDAKFDIPLKSDPAALKRKKEEAASAASSPTSPSPSPLPLPLVDGDHRTSGEAPTKAVGALPASSPRVGTSARGTADSQVSAAVKRPNDGPNGDPLANEGIWYVRTADGQQFGPADSEKMQDWIQQDRIAADCWVWRDSWPDWERATVILRQDSIQEDAADFTSTPVASAPVAASAPVVDGPPALAASLVDRATAPSPSIITDAGPSTDRAPTERHQRTHSRTLRIVFMLGVVCLVLLAALVYVIRR